MKIAFYTGQLSERGTEIAMFDYAYYNEKLLNNQSIIIYETTSIFNNINVINKFKRYFNVIGITNFNSIDKILEAEKCNVLYMIKSGQNDRKKSNFCKTVVHAVFNASQPHGDVYAAISPVLTGYNSTIPIVPHMINLPQSEEHWRKELNIPTDAIVFGRYGGYNQFDIKIVAAVIKKCAQNNKNLYFLFANTRPFCKEMQNIIHLPPIINLLDKVKFINTCDAMIHARSDGETFGLSIGEFSSRNKPIITCESGYLNHKLILGNNAFWYKNADELFTILNNFNVNKNKDWNCFKEYTPEKVMKQFNDIFLK